MSCRSAFRKNIAFLRSPAAHCPFFRTVRYVYWSQPKQQEVSDMNESARPTTSTRCQQVVGALYLLALLALVIFICL